MGFKIKENLLSMKELVLVFVFLATLNTINRYYYFIFAAFGLFVLCSGSKIFLNGSFFALFLLATSLVVFSPDYSYSMLGILKTFTYLMCYVMGYGLYEYEGFNSGKRLKSFYISVIFVVAGPFVHYLLNWISNFSNYSSRNTIDFWTKSIMAATGQAPLSCMAIALAIACLFSNTSKNVKAFSVFAVILALGYNLILSGRTLFILSLIVLVIAFIQKLINQKSQKVRFLFVTLFIILALILAYNFDLLGIRTAVESSPFYDRFFGKKASMDIDEDGRMQKKINYFKNFSLSLFGGSNLHKQNGFAHDIFLDTYDEAGIFALFAIVCYIIATITRMKKCISNKIFPFEFRQIILCLYVILYIQFMVEPILQGMPWLFASFCFIDGGVSRILFDFENQQRLQEE